MNWTPTIPADVAAERDHVYDYESPQEGENPVHHEAAYLSSTLLCQTDEDGILTHFAAAMDEDPLNGVDVAGLRQHAEGIYEFALFILHQTERYLATRRAYYGVADGEELPPDDGEDTDGDEDGEDDESDA